MPRRALRKIGADLDLSRHLKTWDELPQPWDASQLFGRKASLEVEVGSGKGLFLQTAATATPEVDFLGIEIATKYARFAAARLASKQITNAVVVHGDGQRLFAELLPNESVAAVHVYFPDPWWKKRHQKRKVLNEVFLRNVQRVLSTGGSLHYWTDVEDRFAETLELIARETRLSEPFDVAERPAEHSLDYRTHFERRTRLSELPVYRAEFRRT
jgi:tRNA (guanine-N7-)-methyltransferase